MNRGRRPIFHLPLVILIAAAASGPAGAQTPTRWDAYPPGYRPPTTPDVEAEARADHPMGGLRLAERNKLFHMVQLDPSPQQWADNVLRVVVGFTEQWSPTDYYALLPNGYREEPGRAVAFLSTRKIKFGSKFDPDSLEPLRSTSDPRFTLSRVGEHLVLSRGAQRRWYFETPDHGESWRIAMIEEIQRPGQFTEMVYLNDQIVAVRYPNGREATIDYELGRPVRVTTPLGRMALIERSGGYITRIALYHTPADDPGDTTDPSEAPPAPAQARGQAGPGEPIAVHAYQRDAEGKITRYTAPDGSVYRATYRVEQSEEAKLQKVTYITRITREADGAFLERVHEARPKQKEWFIADRYGWTDQDLGDGPIDAALRFTEVNKRWAVVGQARGDADRQTNIKLDERGLPATRVGPTGLTQVMEHDAAGNKTRIVESDGSVGLRTFNELGQPTRKIDARGRETLLTYDAAGRPTARLDPDGVETAYEYDARGFPAAMQVGTRRHTYQTDDWGRLTDVHFSDGASRHWGYDRHGRIASVTTKDALPMNQLITQDMVDGKTTEFLRDERGRVVGVVRPDGATDQVSYSPQGQLHTVDEADGNRVLYRYDKAGRLAHRQDPKRRFESWTYHPDGRIETHRFREADEKRWTQRAYDREGRLVRERVTGEGPRVHTYNALGQLVSTRYPDGTESHFTYDTAGRLVAARGDHQPPVDYRYEDGRRVAYPVDPQPQEAP